MPRARGTLTTRVRTRVDLAWISGQRFDVTSTSGLSATLDGTHESGLAPTEALLASLGACMGIDVVVILEKMRVSLEGLSLVVEGERHETPPRYFHRMRLQFRIRGDVPRDKAERAVRLSFDKYCSVFHTLRKDIDIETVIE